jgi:hypothetical protein
MQEFNILKLTVNEARRQYLDTVLNLTDEQGYFKPEPQVWCAAEITEHLYHAEFGGINSMFKALNGLRIGDPIFKDEHINKGLTIEQVIERTWRPKEEVPAGAEPRYSGPLSFWITALQACGLLLDKLTEQLIGEDAEQIIYPHPISGPLDAGQRYEFLRFHLERHKNQVKSLLSHPEFPSSIKEKQPL